MLEKLSFEIQESPVLYKANGETFQSTKNKVISRSDNNAELSTMKVSYIPLYNKDFMESTERMVHLSGFEFAGYSELDGGRIILAHLKNNLQDFSINGHKIDDYLLMGSSFDGRYSEFYGTTTVFLRCKNQFSHITQAEKVRHTKSAPKRREDLMKSLELYFADRSNMYADFTRMSKVKVDEALKQKAVDYVMQVTTEDRLAEKISTRKVNIMEMLKASIDYEMGDLGNNLWAVMNGVTKYTTHERKQKEVVFGNVFGTTADINSRAYKFALQLI